MSDIKDFLNVEPITISNFFTTLNKPLVVPPFQRAYAWSKNEVSQLLEDITQENENTYFIGSIILMQLENQNYLEVIDGQQRMTTISLFYLALYYLNKSIPQIDEIEENVISDLKKNLIKKFGHIEQNILTLSEQNNNKNDFEELLKVVIKDDNVKTIDDLKNYSFKEVNKIKRFYKNFIFILEAIKKNVLETIFYKLEKELNSKFLNYFDYKWLEKLEKLVFEYHLTNDFTQLQNHIKSLKKDNIDENEYNQYIGELKVKNSLLYLLKEFPLKNSYEDELKNLDNMSDEEIIKTFKEFIDDDILEFFMTKPSFRKVGISQIIEKTTAIKQENNEIINKEITPIVNDFIKIYFYELQKIKELLDNVGFVKINVKNPNSANNLFETINYRGLPLSAMDLIKNDILREISNEDIKNQTKNLNEAIKEWNDNIEVLESPDIKIRFLRHFLIVNYIEKVLKKVPTKSNLVEFYKNILKSTQSKYSFLQTMVKDVKVYQFIINKKYNNDYEKLYEAFVDLNHLSTIPAFSMFLYLLKTETPIDEILEIVKYIKKFFIVRHITNIPEVRFLDKFFIDIVYQIKTNPTTSKIEIIKNQLDKEFGFSLLDEKLERGIYEDNSLITRYLLIEIDNQLNESGKKETYDLWKKNIKDKYIFSIEHIIPQNEDISQKWDLDTKKDANLIYWKNILLENENVKNTEFSEDDKIKIKENHNKYLHMLGNLTLTAYNSNLSDKEFEKKRDAVDKDGKFIGFKNSLALNQDLKFSDENKSLSELEHFRLKHLIERHKEMVKIIKNKILEMDNETL